VQVELPQGHRDRQLQEEDPTGSAEKEQQPVAYAAPAVGPAAAPAPPRLEREERRSAERDRDAQGGLAGPHRSEPPDPSPPPRGRRLGLSLERVLTGTGLERRLTGPDLDRTGLVRDGLREPGRPHEPGSQPEPARENEQGPPHRLARSSHAPGSLVRVLGAAEAPQGAADLARRFVHGLRLRMAVGVGGAIVAPARSSFQTKRPGSSPAMIRLRRLGMTAPPARPPQGSREPSGVYRAAPPAATLVTARTTGVDSQVTKVRGTPTRPPLGARSGVRPPQHGGPQRPQRRMT
jgi:hypothetical protein